MEFSSELNKLFLTQYDGHVNTGKFMSELADIMSRSWGRYVRFDVFICTKARFLTLKERKTFYWDGLLEFLFEKCGEQGWEIEKVEIDQFHNVTPTYDIFLVMR